MYFKKLLLLVDFKKLQITGDENEQANVSYYFHKKIIANFIKNKKYKPREL